MLFKLSNHSLLVHSPESIPIRLSIFFLKWVLKNSLFLIQLKHYYTRLPILILLFHFLIYLYYYYYYFSQLPKYYTTKKHYYTKKKSFLFLQLKRGSYCPSFAYFQWFVETDGLSFCCLLLILCCFRPIVHSNANALSNYQA